MRFYQIVPEGLMSDILRFTQALARDAGKLIVDERANAAITHEYKNGDELVTNADIKADQFICAAIREGFPEHQILSEESSPDLADIQNITSGLWIIDPIDGTVNFAHGHDHSAISIAYVEDGQAKVGVVYNPFSDELFHAEAGKGAFLNDKLISVSTETELRRSLIATGFPYDKSTLAPMIPRLHKVLANCADIRRIGSAALDICFLAMGRLEGYYESLSIWDFAAARLIALEAGAECGHFSEVPPNLDPQFYDRDILIANPAVYPQLLGLLQAADTA
ncbi:MAG: inositol monophosphatase [Pseudohongiella sp.]|nr:MAG: inositol monophosphatase [Pseudohongiella sp.]